MARKRGSKSDGSFFSEHTKKKVWLKAKPQHQFILQKTDARGKPMNWNDYGNTNSLHGWEIDHIKPVSKGGTDEIDNLQALQWQNNRAKADKTQNEWRYGR